jgi:hypothetical protein
VIRAVLFSIQLLPYSKETDMKTNPWFSTAVEDSVVAEPVHHDNTACMAGDSIKKNTRRYGTDNRPLCKQCAGLDAAGR